MNLEEIKIKNKEEAVRGREERLKELSERGAVFLQEAKTLLTQLKRGGVVLYPTTENDIRGLNNNQISNIYMLLNRTYDNFSFDYTDERYCEEEIIRDEKGKPIKMLLNMKFGGDCSENLVFYITELKDGKMGSYERCFIEGQLLSLALEEIEYVLNKSNNYLVLSGDIFYFENKTIPIKSETILYKILRLVYEYFNGNDGRIVLKDLYKKLKTIKELKYRTNEQLARKVRQDLSSKTMGFHKHINNLKRLDGLKIFTVEKETLIFRNTKKVK